MLSKKSFQWRGALHSSSVHIEQCCFIPSVELSLVQLLPRGTSTHKVSQMICASLGNCLIIFLKPFTLSFFYQHHKRSQRVIAFTETILKFPTLSVKSIIQTRMHQKWRVGRKNGRIEGMVLLLPFCSTWQCCLSLQITIGFLTEQLLRRRQRIVKKTRHNMLLVILIGVNKTRWPRETSCLWQAT